MIDETPGALKSTLSAAHNLYILCLSEGRDGNALRRVYGDERGAGLGGGNRLAGRVCGRSLSARPLTGFLCGPGLGLS